MAFEKESTAHWKERVGVMAVGHSFKQIEELIFDYTLYPAIIALFGTMVGGLVMTIFSALVCYLYILVYDWSKKDWLGLELIKKMRDGIESRGYLARFIQKVMQKSNYLAFLVLSCLTDPFVTTMYLRQGAEKYDGLTSKDWRVFWGSVLVANLWWTTLMSFAVAGIRIILHRLGFN